MTKTRFLIALGRQHFEGFFSNQKNGSSPERADNVEQKFKALAYLVGSKNVTEIFNFWTKNAIF